jgi:ABC-type Co2+ transport system permease subunit
VHIHIPDGVLPVWLWMAGYVVTLALVALGVLRVRGQERKGVLAAAMVPVTLVEDRIFQACIGK